MAAPAALHLSSALDETHGPPVHVAIDVGRQAVDQPGVRVHRIRDIDSKVQWTLTPPRVRVEEAILSWGDGRKAGPAPQSLATRGGCTRCSFPPTRGRRSARPPLSPRPASSSP